MPRTSHLAQALLGFVLLAASLSALYISFMLSKETYTLVKQGVHTEGQVTTLVKRTNSKNRGFVYSPVVRFRTTDGQILSFEGATGTNPPAYEVGEIVKVIYLPSKPEDASIDSFFQLWSANILVGFIGLAFLITFIAGTVSLVGKWRLQAWLKQHGQRITTTFQYIEPDFRMRVNQRTGYKIISEGKNPVTGEIQTFRSDTIWDDPEPQLKGRTSIDVLIHPQDPRKYWVDLSFLP